VLRVSVYHALSTPALSLREQQQYRVFVLASAETATRVLLTFTCLLIRAVMMSADTPRSYSSFSWAFPAQRKPIVLTKASTDSLLDHPIKVYQQTKNKDFHSNSGNVITFSCAPSSEMTFKQFLQNYTVWFASIVMKMEQLDGINPFESSDNNGWGVAPQDLEVAVAAISSIPDVDTFDNTYYDYMKKEDVINLGYYVKDQYPMPSCISVSDMLCTVICYL